MKSKPAVKPAPVHKQFANLWTLTHQPSAEKEWSLEEKLKQAKQAGFDGVGGGVLAEIPPLCKEYGLDYICYVDGAMKTYQEKLVAAQSMNPTRVNIQLCDHDTPPAEAAEVWIKMAAEAEKMGLEVDLEVHRDTCTETPEKVYEIARLYKEATGRDLRFCFDFSHIAVVKHIYPPYAKRLLVEPALVQLSRQVHFRPFNGHHCQVPALDSKGRETPEIKPYLEFVDDFFACWMAGAQGGEVLYSCPEFGPGVSGYGLSVFPDVWKDAIFLRNKIEELWEKNLRKAEAGV